MNIELGLDVSALYAGLLGIMFVVFTLRVGLYRKDNRISLGDGGDAELLKRMRAQGNFCETVPIALILLVLMETSGASNGLLHGLGSVLVAGRMAHFLQLSELIKPIIFRMLGMMATLLVILVSSAWLLMGVLG